MPPLSELPNKLKRNKFAKALEGLGFKISTKGGKGSHFKATHIKTQKMVVIPSNLDKQTLYYVLKEIENLVGITWEEIKKNL